MAIHAMEAHGGGKMRRRLGEILAGDPGRSSINHAAPPFVRLSCPPFCLGESLQIRAFFYQRVFSFYHLICRPFYLLKTQRDLVKIPPADSGLLFV